MWSGRAVAYQAVTTGEYGEYSWRPALRSPDNGPHPRHAEHLTPFEAIRKAAAIRVRPITMTALAAFFAMIPAALAIERGSEANAPLARAILGGLLAGEPATLFVLPCLYTLMVRDRKTNEEDEARATDESH